MHDFDQSGFLSIQADEFAQNTKNQHRELTELYEALNDRAVCFLMSASVQRDDLQEILCALYYSRIVTLFQGIYLMGIRGMSAESDILARSMVEAHFKLHYADQSHEWACKLVQSDEVERLKLLKNARTHGRNRSKEKEAELDKLIFEIQSEINSSKIRRLSTKQIAEDLKKEWEYDLMYSSLCGPLHAGPRSFRGSIGMNSNGEVEALRWLPDCRKLNLQFGCAMDLMLQAMATNSFPCLDPEGEEYRELSAKIMSFMKK